MQSVSNPRRVPCLRLPSFKLESAVHGNNESTLFIVDSLNPKTKPTKGGETAEIESTSYVKN